MYPDKIRSKVRRRILVDRLSIHQVVRETGISRNTIRKILRTQVRQPLAIKVPSRRATHRARLARKPTKADNLSTAFDWMRSALQHQIELDTLQHQVGNLPHLEELVRHLYEGTLSDRNRSMVIIANRHGLSIRLICRFLGISRNTVRRYLRAFAQAGVLGLFARRTQSNRKFDNPSVRDSLFELLHEPPSNYGINRTSWTMHHLVRILHEKGCPVSAAVVRKIVKLAGYRWRKARVVLTSSDPTFSEKLARVRSILADLRPDEAFFSIDEFGPFAVKTHPGLALTAPGEQRTVPQWQKSRGCLILTAALELSGNQVHHFFSKKKNTTEMIRMKDILVERYRDRRNIYLSWDAASWHISKQLYQEIDQHNAKHERPAIATAPLPAGAQFLNVIESVFSGMARAIIHNSNYKTADEAMAAIERYFTERNEHFRQYPQRAGKKIWRMEREPAAFSAANNCKDPRFR